MMVSCDVHIRGNKQRVECLAAFRDLNHILGNLETNKWVIRQKKSLAKHAVKDMRLMVFCLFAGPMVDPRKVLIIAGHHNWIVAAYAHFVICYR